MKGCRCKPQWNNDTLLNVQKLGTKIQHSQQHSIAQAQNVCFRFQAVSPAVMLTMVAALTAFTMVSWGAPSCSEACPSRGPETSRCGEQVSKIFKMCIFVAAATATYCLACACRPSSLLSPTAKQRTHLISFCPAEEAFKNLDGCCGQPLDGVKDLPQVRVRVLHGAACMRKH